MGWGVSDAGICRGLSGMQDGGLSYDYVERGPGLLVREGSDDGREELCRWDAVA